MARIRTIKPDLARHEGLYNLEQETGLPVRFAWAMLFTACDKEGRFRWRPAVLKLDILPFDDIDFSRVLDAWLTRGYLVKYRVGNEWYGWIPTWRRHQSINNKESDSTFPSIDEAEEVQSEENHKVADASATRESRVNDASQSFLGSSQGEGEGKGKGEREGERKKVCAELSRVAITFTLNDKSEFEITEDQVSEYESLYPGIDVMQELRKIKGWSTSNSKNRKTRKGAARFVNAWLSRAQDHSSSRGNGNGTSTHESGGPRRQSSVETVVSESLDRIDAAQARARR